MVSIQFYRELGISTGELAISIPCAWLGKFPGLCSPLADSEGYSIWNHGSLWRVALDNVDFEWLNMPAEFESLFLQMMGIDCDSLSVFFKHVFSYHFMSHFQHELVPPCIYPANCTTVTTGWARRGCVWSSTSRHVRDLRESRFPGLIRRQAATVWCMHMHEFVK